jgi:hypothetical protein
MCSQAGGTIGHAVGHTASGLWNKAKGFASTAAQNIGSQLEGFAEGGEVHHCSTGMPHDENCPHFADGGTVQDNTQFAQDPGLAVDHAILQNGLLHTLTKTGRTKSDEPGRASSEFIESAKKGKKKLAGHAKSLLDPKAEPIKSNPEEVDGLEKHLNELRMNPHLAENVGGDLGDNLPDHQVHLAAKLASVMNHFDSIRPASSQGGPLDKINPPSQKEMAHYRRQLEVAQNPALVYQKAKQAMLQPGDMNTLQSIYPKLHDSMVSQAGDAVVDAKSEGKELPKHAKRGLGQLMSQNLGFVHTPLAMQFIIQANSSVPPQGPGKSKGKATNKAVDESNKTAQLEATPLQSRQLDKRD